MVIDTDILIDHFHGNVNATAFIERMLLAGQELFISIAAVAEILAGVRPGEEEGRDRLRVGHAQPAPLPDGRHCGESALRARVLSRLDIAMYLA